MKLSLCMVKADTQRHLLREFEAILRTFRKIDFQKNKRPRGASRKHVIFHEGVDFLELFFIKLSIFWSYFHEVVDFLELFFIKLSICWSYFHEVVDLLELFFIKLSTRFCYFS